MLQADFLELLAPAEAFSMKAGSRQGLTGTQMSVLSMTAALFTLSLML